uniref:Uncharacterized protein n=1 Tax=Peronospora matthiolae TaxID=2874970 RepID=A0AAV1U961_9STRA
MYGTKEGRKECMYGYRSAAVPFQPTPRRCDNSAHFDRRRQPLRAACLCHQSPEPGRRRLTRVICPTSLARSRALQAGGAGGSGRTRATRSATRRRLARSGRLSLSKSLSLPR